MVKYFHKGKYPQINFKVIFWGPKVNDLLTLFAVGLKIYVKWWGVFATPLLNTQNYCDKPKNLFFQIGLIKIGKVTMLTMEVKLMSIIVNCVILLAIRNPDYTFTCLGSRQ